MSVYLYIYVMHVCTHMSTVSKIDLTYMYTCKTVLIFLMKHETMKHENVIHVAFFLFILFIQRVLTLTDGISFGMLPSTKMLACLLVRVDWTYLLFHSF